jgi:membrane protease YdiL (CAAX protease family)
MPAADDERVSSSVEPRPRRRRLEPWPSPTARARSWTVAYAFKAYLAMWVILVATGLALWLAGARVGFGLGALLTEAVFLSTLIPLWRRGDMRARDLGLRTVPGGRTAALAFLGLVAYVWVNVLWQRALNPAPVSGNFIGVSHEGTLAIVLAGFVACVGAPVAEEIFFRGFLYRSLRNRMTVLPACLIASMLFGLVHTQYSLSEREVIVAFGVITCLLYERTGSLLPGMAVHSFVDGGGFEHSLTGNATIVTSVYALLALILIARPPLKGLARLMTRRPVFGDYSARPVAPVELLGFPASQSQVLHAGDLVAAIGPVGARLRTGRFWATLAAVLVVVVFAGLFRPATQSQQSQALAGRRASAGSPPPTCIEAGIDSAGGNEGTCVEGPAASPTTVVVVDRARTLRMPEYAVRLLGSEAQGTRVTNASREPGVYPNGEGQLLSYELSVTNTGSQPFVFGVGPAYVTPASYVPNPIVELSLPESSDVNDSLTNGYEPLIDGHGAPRPGLLQQPPIEPGETRTGWVSFVAPVSSLRSMYEPGADVDFYRAQSTAQSYRGSIRLWK